MKIAHLKRSLATNYSPDYYDGDFPPNLRTLKFLMKIAPSRSNLSHMAPNERALFKCAKALELKDKGDYAGAQDVMRPLWKRVGERPNLDRGEATHADIEDETDGQE